MFESFEGTSKKEQKLTYPASLRPSVDDMRREEK
jgi:hypothetical protein